MTFETLAYEESGDIATIRLQREFVNVQMIRDLTAVCDRLEDESQAKVVVFRGANGNFSRGLDFAEFNPDQPIDIHGFNKWERMVARIERLPKISIAVAEGATIGGGALGILLACDARIASPTMELQLPEVKMGFLPGMAVFRLAKYIGLGRAKRLVIQSPVVSAREAEALGLVDEVAEDVDKALAETIQRCLPVLPVTVQLARRLVNECYSSDFENYLGSFLAAQQRTITHDAFLGTLRRKTQRPPKPE